MMGRCRPVVARTSYARKPPVPRVPDFWLDSIIYLYPSEGDAWAGTEFGGTGFIVAVPREDERVPDHIGHLYLVTNDHVRLDSRAVRFNLHGGNFDVVAVEPDEWIEHQDGDDIAVREIMQHDAHKYSCINLSMLLTPDVQPEPPYGPGDEVFFMGRYVDHAGHAHNEPTVREGIISGIPSEPISQLPERKHEQESILVEARSLSGFSGSPVYVTRTGTIEQSPDFKGAPIVVNTDEQPVYLLGIDWGHHPWQEPVIKDRTPIPGLYIDGNSGMMMVIPAAKLVSLLTEHPDLIAKRREAEREFIATAGDWSAVGATLDSAKLPEGPGGEFENFEDLTRKLVQTPKPKAD